MKIEENIFNNLDKWRHLPAYQLERRADVFIAAYLPAFIEKILNQKVQTIIPEFPVRIGSIDDADKENNRSFKIDYVVKLKDSHRVLFIELKTDDKSERSKQNDYLHKAKIANMYNLIDGIQEICKATNAKNKYFHLLTLLREAEFLNSDEQANKINYNIDIVYIKPTNLIKDYTVWDFNQFATFVESYTDSISKRFAKSLREWAGTRAGSTA